MGERGPLPTNLRTEVVGDDFYAYVDDEKVSHLNFWEDDLGRAWLTEAATNGQWRRRGIGLELMKAAAELYCGEIYASRASQRECENNFAPDSLWLTTEGAALVHAAIAAGIMPRSHLRHHLGDDDEHWREVEREEREARNVDERLSDSWAFDTDE